MLGIIIKGLALNLQSMLAHPNLGGSITSEMRRHPYMVEVIRQMLLRTLPSSVTEYVYDQGVNERILPTEKRWKFVETLLDTGTILTPTSSTTGAYCNPPAIAELEISMELRKFPFIF